MTFPLFLSTTVDVSATVSLRFVRSGGPVTVQLDSEDSGGAS